MGKRIGVWGEVRGDVWGVWKSVRRGVEGMLECEGRWDGDEGRGNMGDVGKCFGVGRG